MSRQTPELQQLFATVESTPGTAESVAGTDLIRCEASSIEFAEVPVGTPDLDLAGPTLYTEEPADEPSIIRYDCKFRFPLRRCAAAGSAPEGAQVLRAHGCAQTLTSSTSALYEAPAAPNSGGTLVSLTLRWQQANGLVHTAHGFRPASLKISWSVGQPVMVEVSGPAGWSTPAAWSSFTAATETDIGVVSALDVLSANPITVAGSVVYCTSYELTSDLAVEPIQAGAGGSPGYGFIWPGALGRSTQPSKLSLTYLAPAANTESVRLATQSAGVAIVASHGASGVDAILTAANARLRSYSRIEGRPAQIRADYTLHTDRARADVPWSLLMAA